MSLTKKERREREQSFPKCWCGNTIGLHAQQQGLNVCSAHQEIIDEQTDFNNNLADLRQKGRELGCDNHDLEVVIDLIADMMELLHNK